MGVRAKMQVQQITEYSYASGQKEVKLRPVYEDGGVNKTWAQATPDGEIRLMINNPAAANQFKVGEYFFIDLTPTTKEAQE